MKILFVGDIVGSPGREAVKTLIPKLRKELGAEVVIANAENAAGGSGITPKIAEELFKMGVELLTSGDHIWKRREIYQMIDSEPRLIRPANYPEGAPGRGGAVVTTKDGTKVAVINLLGRVFMNSTVECPFKHASKEMELLKKEAQIIIVDFHAEATSEKIAMGWYLDGAVTAVLGSHTHVQTADERILPKGTAYITDVGMTGPHDSVIGRRVEQILERFLSGLPTRFEVANENIQLNGVVIEVDPKTGKAISIERIQRKL